MTDLEATRSGVTGMRWFDRRASAGNFRNYFGGKTSHFVNKHIGQASTPTLFEAASPWGWTAAASANYNRGANVTSSSGITLGLAKLKHRWWVSRYILSLPILRFWLAPSFEAAEDKNFSHILAQLQWIPKVHWCVFGSTDSSMHALGLGKHYEDALIHIDQLIGLYRETSVMLGTERDRMYAVVTDHGAANVSRNIDLSAALRAAGARPLQGRSGASDVDLSLPLTDLSEKDVCVLINGDTMAHLYFSHPHFATPEGWHHRVDRSLLQQYPTHTRKTVVDVPTFLLKQEGVELVITWLMDARVAYVQHSGGGQACIKMNGTGSLAYILTSEPDPLRYHRCLAAELVTHSKSEVRFYSANQWLDRTHDCDFPYGVVRLYQLMSAPGGSDVVVTALRGYDFGRNFEVLIGNFQGGHGGVRADQLRVPYILSGYGVRGGVRINAARAEDVGATLYYLLTGGHTSPALNPHDPEDPFSRVGIDQDLFRGTVLNASLLR